MQNKRTLQKTQCDYCGDTVMMQNPNTYCIDCSMQIRDYVKRKMNDRYTSDGLQIAKRHWDHLPHYVQYDLIEQTSGIKGVSS